MDVFPTLSLSHIGTKIKKTRNVVVILQWNVWFHLIHDVIKKIYITKEITHDALK